MILADEAKSLNASSQRKNSCFRRMQSYARQGGLWGSLPIFPNPPAATPSQPPTRKRNTLQAIGKDIPITTMTNDANCRYSLEGLPVVAHPLMPSAASDLPKHRCVRSVPLVHRSPLRLATPPSLRARLQNGCLPHFIVKLEHSFAAILSQMPHSTCLKLIMLTSARPPGGFRKRS
jgi:hypothetical protein